MNLQHDWQQLLRLTLLGTRQSGEAVPALPGLPTDSAAAPEEQALLAAGALSLVRKAGVSFPTDTVPAAPPAAPETLPPLGHNGRQCLQQLLEGHYTTLLPDYLTQLAAQGRRVPHALLVPLLNYARTRPELHTIVAAVLGERGAWLARLNPAWQEVLAGVPSPTTEAWETGTSRQRQLYLQALRRHHPTEARELLAAALPQEPAKQQAALLGTLAIGLNAGDAPLLEQYLTSKSKDVRQVAAPLLARTPGNALVGRLMLHASPYLSFKTGLFSGKKLEINLPDAWSPVWQADGIEPKDARFTGEKAAWFGQTLALIPPQQWTSQWNIAPAKLLELALESDWATLLLPAWQQALLLHRSHDWAVAYLTLQLTQPNIPPLTAAQAAELTSPAALAQLLLDNLPRYPRFTQTETSWETLLLSAPGPWPPALTTQALQFVENTITLYGSLQRYSLHYRLAQLLRHMQLVVPPEQYQFCATALTPLRELDTSLNTHINQLLDALHFRQQLAQSLTEPPGPDA